MACAEVTGDGEGVDGQAGLGEIDVSVAYSPQPRVVERVSLRLAAGATVEDALRASGLAERHDWPASEALHVAIWSKPTALNTALREADRVEVTRGLLVDPKEARRQRYQKQPDQGARRRKAAKA